MYFKVVRRRKPSSAEGTKGWRALEGYNSTLSLGAHPPRFCLECFSKLSHDKMKSEVSSKKKEPKRDKGTRWKAYSAKKVGPANAAPAVPATTVLAPFPTDDHKAADTYKAIHK